MFLLYPFKYCVFGIVNYVHIYSMSTSDADVQIKRTCLLEQGYAILIERTLVNENTLELRISDIQQGNHGFLNISYNTMFLLYPFKYCVFGIVNHVHIYSMKDIKIQYIAI
jgi:hypothetical protein